MPKIIVAKNAGFCPGVKNAIDKVIDLSKKTGKKIYTLGPLIHNKDVIKALEEKNIFAVEEAGEIKEKGAILVIRAHGIPPNLEKKIRSLELEPKVIDGTCPLVKNAHKTIEKYAALGYHTVIVGDKNHAEVIGLMGYAGEAGVSVVNGPEEAKLLPPLKKVNLVAQTTQEENVFAETLTEVRGKTEELIISNTICDPTRQRQRETIEFSKTSDLVIVVGGRHSANTQRLYQICGRLAKKAVLAENAEELDETLFNGVESIFITAGASTPNWLIEKVHEKVRKLAKAEREGLYGKLLLLWKTIVTSGVYTGTSAAFLTYASSRILGAGQISKKILFVSAMFVLSLHVINRALEKSSAEADDLKKLLFIKFRSTTKFMAYLFGATAILLSYGLNLKIFFSLSIMWLVGMMYPYKFFQHIYRIPASKDFILATGWTFACAVIPVFWLKDKLSDFSSSAFAFIFLLSFIRSILLSVSQSYNDMIVGRENLYKAAGEKKTNIILFFSLLLVLFFFLSASSNVDLAHLRIPMMLSLFYYAGLALFFGTKKIPDKITSEVIVDFQFILLGLASML